jgi:GNAT superfamily N-acetyltransferase
MGLMDLAAATSDWTLSPSPLDSDRFGFPVARLVVRRGGVDLAGVTAALRCEPATVVVARYPAELSDVASALSAGRRRLVPAGTLVYWEASLRVENTPRDPGVDVVALADATADSDGLIDALVRDAFTGYTSHYRYTPLFDPALVAEGYVEWARSCIGRPGCDVLVLRVHGEPAGLAAIGTDGPDRDVLLAGVSHRFQGRGHYRALLQAARGAALLGSSRRVVISTQASNIRVQRAWIRDGWRPIDAFETVHLLRGDDRGESA